MSIFFRAIGKCLEILGLMALLVNAFTADPEADILGRAMVGIFLILGWIGCELAAGWIESVRR